MDSTVAPPAKRKKHNPPPSFLSLPDVIIQHCVAQISRSYYPKLSLVSKTFRDLVLSLELRLARFHHKTQQLFFHVCLRSPNPLPSWYTLWIKPDKILTYEINKKKDSTANTLLVPVLSSYFPVTPLFIVTVGLEYYALRQNYDPSPVMLVRNKAICTWREAPKMTIARVNAVAAVLDGKIYVMGGCGENESTNWAEVFDTKTQTWESLPDPGAELRSSLIRNIEVLPGKLKVRTHGKKDYVYDPKEGKWDIVLKSMVQCKIGDIWVRCNERHLQWYDTNRNEWRVVRDLSTLNKKRGCGMIEIAEYHGELLILWQKFVVPGPRDQRNIWCALIALERCNNDGEDVKGKVKWANIVLTVPSSYSFLRSLKIIC